MRCTFTLMLVLLFLSSAHSQPLTLGIYNNHTLASDHYRVTSISPGCYSYWYDLSYNGFAIPSGMTLYYRIDSIVGPIDSVRLWRSADMSGYRVVHGGDTVRAKPLTGGATNMYAYFYDTAIIYTSLHMTGIPDTAGQPYFCTYGVRQLLWFDDLCARFSCEYYGGTGELDTVQGCNVSSAPTEVSSLAGNGFHIFPDPASGVVTISGTENIESVTITDVRGTTVLNSSPRAQTITLNVRDLPAGIYFARINNTRVLRFLRQ